MTAATRIQRARSFLDRTLFPESPPPPRVTLRRALICALVVLAAVGIQLLRAHAAKPLDTLWAEDGSTWIPDAMHHGIAHNLVTPYNGYLQTVSRLVATPVSWLPVSSFPPLMSIAGALIVTGCAFLVWRASAAHISSPVLRGGLAALVVVTPVAGMEAIANVTNTIWYLLFASFWVLLWRPATIRRATGAAAFLLLAALSSAGSLVLLPLLALRGLAARDRRDWVMVGAFSAGLVIQVALSWSDRNLTGEGSVQAPAPPAHWGWSLIPAFGQRALGGAVTGQRITGHAWTALNEIFFVVVGLALIAWLAAVFLRGSNRVRILVPLALVLSLALFLFSGYQRWAIAGRDFYWPLNTFNSFDSRYMIVPSLLVASALFIWLDEAMRTYPLPWRRLAPVVPAVVAVSAIASFGVDLTFFRAAIPWSDALDQARRTCAANQRATVDVPVPPGGTFKMPLSCSKLQ